MRSDETAGQMEWGECWLEPVTVPPELASEVRKITGGVLPGWARRMASVPWLVRGFARLVQKRLAYMPLMLWDLSVLVVSQDNSCRYCYGATRTVLRVLGYSDEAIDRLERDIHLADISPAEQSALQFVRRLSQANPRPGTAELAGLSDAGFSRPAIAEITYAAAIAGFHNRVSTLFALPSESFERWLVNPLGRLLRPLIAPKLRGKRQPPMALPDPNPEPCAEVIASLDGSPTAHALRRTIDEAMASPVLPRRTKLLMLAVIGRALGCPRTEAEARRDLGSEDIGGDDIDQVLSNLNAPFLDERERLLVPFARETVRYRNAAIQARTRELGERLGRDATLEAVGVTALANSVARLSVLLETW